MQRNQTQKYEKAMSQLNSSQLKIIMSFLFCAIIFSCTQTGKEGQKENECTTYACPMHPDKTSTTPALCPECKMNMDPVDSVLIDSGIV